ncbi:MAG: WG repeat-containing protein, partial [Pedobacter sp.]
EYDSGQSYYLLKNGKKIGRDSLYIWDMTYDFEQEEKIRFRDLKTDKVGFFGPNGKIIIPAIYDDAQPFRNGTAVVLYNARHICADGSIYDPKHPCEHWNWDGITALIDTENNVIADSLDLNSLSYINWYSMKKSDKPADTILQRSYKSKDGHYLSFLDYEKGVQILVFSEVYK